MPHTSIFAVSRDLAVWATILGTLWCSGCARLRLTDNDEALRQLDELPPAIKIETATPVGMTTREQQAREQERARLRSDAQHEPVRRRRGTLPETSAPRFQPAEQSSDPAATQALAGHPSHNLSASRSQLSTASQAEYLRALDQAGVTDSAERADMLAALEATDPSYRAIMLRTLKASHGQRRQKVVEPRAVSLERNDIREEEAIVTTGKENPLRHRDNLAMVSQDSPAEVLPNSTVRVEQPLARTTQDLHVAKLNPTATPSPIRQVAHSEPEPVREIPTTKDPELLFKEALAGLERQLKNGTAERATEIAAIRVRLLQALGGQRDAALEPVPNLSPPQQEFLSQQVYALAALVDQQGNSLWSRRAGLAAEHLQTAAEKLGQQAGLLVRNAQLCTEIKAFGNYTTFTKTTFRPGQEVLLYAELDRYQTRDTERGFHTKFHAGYQILDRNGRKIVEKELGLAEEHSQVRRRDYFVSYLVRLPAELLPEEYTLKLLIEDQLGGQVGETSVRLIIEGSTSAVLPLPLKTGS